MTYATEVAADTPVHWWRCNEPPGAMVIWDRGSSKLPMRPQAAAPWGLGFYGVAADGGAYAWTGTTQFPISYVVTEPLYVLPPYTVEEWIWIDAVRSISTIMGQVGNNEGYYHSLSGIPSAPGVKVGSKHLGATTEIILGAPSLHNWHHVVSTHDGTNLKGYLDAVLINTLACVAPVNENTQFSFGEVMGYFSEIALYSTALSAARIAAHYAARIPTDPTARPLADLSSTTADLSAVLAAVRRTF